MLVAHPHFHRRRTGVTAHTEAILKALQGLVEAVGLGSQLTEVPLQSFKQVWQRAGHEEVVWHAHRNLETIAGLVFRGLGRRVKVVTTRHTGAPPGRFTRWLYRYVDALVALTDDSASTLGRAAQIVPHGVDVSRFAVPQDRAAAAAALGMGPGPVIGILGRVRLAKGTADFVHAYSKLSEPWPGLVQGLVKPGDQAFAASLQRIAPRLHWRPPSDDVRAVLQGLSVLVQPSHSEGFSMMTLEAMATGCCVVATALPYTKGLIEHERTGLLYPPGDVEALRTCIDRVMRNSDLAQRLGSAGAEAIRARHTVAVEAGSLAALYAMLGDEVRSFGSAL